MAVRISQGLIDLHSSSEPAQVPGRRISAADIDRDVAERSQLALNKILSFSASQERIELRDPDEAEKLSLQIAVRLRDDDPDGQGAHSELLVSSAEAHLVQ
jgi:hypothetical protein